MSAAFAVAATIRLIVFHSPDGHEVHINPAEVTSLRGKHDAAESNKLFTDNVSCMISLSDGKYVTVVETCPQVRGAIEEATR